MTTSTSSQFHLKYRPRSFDEVIGHEVVVTRLKGMLKTGEIPPAMMFTGSSSSGKTTLASAMAGTVNGKPPAEQRGDFKLLNAASEKGIDDMRELIRLSKHRPFGKKRFIVIDEAQALMTNKQALQALLVPLESETTKDTVWIPCTMEPEKFKATEEGRAFLGRCMQFSLSPHTQEDKLAMAKRIVVAEGMKYLKSTELLGQIIEAAPDMRSVCNMVQSAKNYYDGLKKKPEKFTMDMVSMVVESTQTPDDKLAADVIVNMLKGGFSKAAVAILDVQDHFKFINTLLAAAIFLLNVRVLDGKKHRKVMWWMPTNKMVNAALSKEKLSLGLLGALVECLTTMKADSMNFSVDPGALITSRVYRFIKDNVAAKKD